MAGDGGLVYCNEIDPFAAQWIRNLYPDATVDERSIADVMPADVIRFARCHWFAGIAGWEYALQLAGWPQDWPIWTGSCPCQPLSCAGRRGGEKDERHLWPEFHRLIRECRPAIVVGEQVASKDGCEWLDGISLDLERLGYAVGAVDLPAASVGAPHIRQRLFWVGIANSSRRSEAVRWGRKHSGIKLEQGCSGVVSRLGDSDSKRLSLGQKPHSQSERSEQPTQRRHDTGGHGRNGLLGNAIGTRLAGRQSQPGDDGQECPTAERAGGDAGYWSDYHVVYCRDDKLRRISAQPGDEPLAARIPRGMGSGQPELGRMVKRARANRVGRLRGYGNAICPWVAAEFMRVVIEWLEMVG